MKRELNKEEKKFIDFVENVKKELTQQNQKKIDRQLLSVKLTGIERKELKRKSARATWIEVKQCLKNKKKLDVFKSLDSSLKVGVRFGNWKLTGVPKHILIIFQITQIK